jgi:hypothetical protein
MVLKISLAHEGHDHDAPTTIVAPKGGSIKSLEEHYVEVTSKKNDLKIYFYAKDLKPVPVTLFKVKASAFNPKTKKTDEIKLVAKEKYLETTFEAKGTHRYDFILEVTPIEHTDKLTFTIETKK